MSDGLKLLFRKTHGINSMKYSQTTLRIFTTKPQSRVHERVFLFAKQCEPE
jgi:hypothetical protein